MDIIEGSWVFIKPSKMTEAAKGGDGFILLSSAPDKAGEIPARRIFDGKYVCIRVDDICWVKETPYQPATLGKLLKSYLFESKK